MLIKLNVDLAAKPGTLALFPNQQQWTALSALRLLPRRRALLRSHVSTSTTSAASTAGLPSKSARTYPRRVLAAATGAVRWTVAL